ncbi:AN1-type zinc finger protein [Methanoregula sp.]|uniref:AN1-type zinc finger protein n=1 Tax=Methanoregula sp. TaxID=2052170 RepID=UPI00236B67E5|nr:AN1-type zinc finger protein [Methanoregula sp.]MDD1687096.1 AN1-type zinc finger domain-containing protein [Methanoregula sp.]
MGIGERVARFFSGFRKKKEYPLYETCAVCGERVYLPFFCEYCRRYYCDRHRLPFDHECKNIGKWKEQRK